MKSYAKKVAFHGYSYQERFQKKEGKRVAVGLTRARLVAALRKDADE